MSPTVGLIWASAIRICGFYSGRVGIAYLLARGWAMPILQLILRGIADALPDFLGRRIVGAANIADRDLRAGLRPQCVGARQGRDFLALPCRVNRLQLGHRITPGLFDVPLENPGERIMMRAVQQ